MKIIIDSHGSKTIGRENIPGDLEAEIREVVAARDTGVLADITDSWRSNVYHEDTLTVAEDDGTVIWKVTL